MAGMTAIAPVLVTVQDLRESRGRLVPAGTTQVLNLARLTEDRLAPLTAPDPVPYSKASTVLVLAAMFLFVSPVTLVLKELIFAGAMQRAPFKDALTMDLLLGGTVAAGAALVASTIVLALAGGRAREDWAAAVLTGWARHDPDLRTLDTDATALAARLQDCAIVLNNALHSGALTGVAAAFVRGSHNGAVSALGVYTDTRSAGSSPDRAAVKAAALAAAHDAVEAVELIAWRQWCQQEAPITPKEVAV
jgi:hypothetical protein